MKHLIPLFQGLGALLLLLGLGVILFGRPGPAGEEREALTVKGLEVGMWPAGIATGEALAHFRQRHPEVQVNRWNSFRIPGDMSIASELMAFAGRSAPDVTFTYIHRLQFYISQGFFHPLNEFIARDLNGNGVIEDSEVHWKPWLEIPPLFRRLGMSGTEIFAIPNGLHFSVMAYRSDLLEAAGIDPEQFPQDFESFFAAGQRICALSLRNPGAHRIYAFPRELEGLLQSLALSAGATPGVGDIVNAEGKIVGQLFPEDDPSAKLQELGLDPSHATIRWRAQFNDAATQQALEAIQRLCWQPWVLNPHTEAPLNLTATDIAAGGVQCPATGRLIVLAESPGGIQYGICPPAKIPGVLGDSDISLLQRGELAIVMLQNSSIAELERHSAPYRFALPPSLRPGEAPAVVAIPMLFGLNGDLRDEKLLAAWQFLAYRSGNEWGSAFARSLIAQGQLHSLSPLDAERFQFREELHRFPESWVRVTQEAVEHARVIPNFPGYQQAETEFFARTTRRISDAPDTLILRALDETQRDVDTRILRQPGERQSPLSLAFAALLLLGSLLATGWGIRAVTRPLGGRVSLDTYTARRTPAAFWLLVLPAVLCVAIWSYYPIIRGFMLAFQDYRLDGTSRWIGLENFVEGAWSSRFWYTIWNTIRYTLMNTALGFFAPIALAILLNEIPKGKYLFRTLFFLPSVTSGLVIMLLWIVIYEPSPQGLLNQIVHPFVTFWNAVSPSFLTISYPVRWLQNPGFAMLCVIIPSVWASIGSGCLIYLAALQSISPDLYEAAEIDGAGFRKKLFHVTLPYLRPLLIINLIGVFIGSAQGWSNIFIMTGGGPELSTQVAALEIWSNSFVFLRFGMATAQAWVLGSLLIGFTVWQIKQMQKVEFRKAGAY